MNVGHVMSGTTHAFVLQLDGKQPQGQAWLRAERCARTKASTQRAWCGKETVVATAAAVWAT